MVRLRRTGPAGSLLDGPPAAHRSGGLPGGRAAGCDLARASRGPKPWRRTGLRASLGRRASEAEAGGNLTGQRVERDADLLGGVPVADRHGVVLQGGEVDG